MQRWALATHPFLRGLRRAARARCAQPLRAVCESSPARPWPPPAVTPLGRRAPLCASSSGGSRPLPLVFPVRPGNAVARRAARGAGPSRAAPLRAAPAAWRTKRCTTGCLRRMKAKWLLRRHGCGRRPAARDAAADVRALRAAAAQEDSWQVISSFFEAKGLVRQQLVRCRRRCLRSPHRRARRVAACLPRRVARALRLTPGRVAGLFRRVYSEHDAGNRRQVPHPRSRVRAHRGERWPTRRARRAGLVSSALAVHPQDTGP